MFIWPHNMVVTDMNKLYIILLLNIFFMKITLASGIDLVSNGISGYVILTDPNADEVEQKAAVVLQQYIYKVSNTRINIANDDGKRQLPFIKLKNTYDNNDGHEKQGYIIEVKDNNLYFTGYGDKGILYSIYTFIEQVLLCTKLAPGEPAIIHQNDVITIDKQLRIEEYPDFLYREVYSMAEIDEEYLDWHKLNSMDRSWGLWGHSVFKLVPPASYFDKHPEYYSYFNDKRQAIQLCLSNPDVVNIAANTLKKIINDNPHAEYWSVSSNDNIVVCECDNCKKINKEERSQSGTLIRFVNSLAKKFPKRKLVTLAYQNTSWPPFLTKPAENVYIMLSSIDLYRSEPIEVSSSAKAFINKLNGWKKLTKNIFVWDYYTQFTNLLAPFPIEQTLGENMSYLKKEQVKGIFAQMNEFTYGDLSELKMYLMAKLMWNTNLNQDSLTNGFLASYYKNAAPYVKDYLDKRKQAVIETKVRLDIYGNPVNNQRDFLSPQWMDSYSITLDQAERAAHNPAVSERIKRLRLPLEYTYLQQARSYGIAPHGIWQEDQAGNLVINNYIKTKLENFYQLCKQTGIKNITEDGITLEEYKAEWDSILMSVPGNNLAANASITLRFPFVEEYAIKGIHTLNDRLNGYDDFSYNWLCFDGVPMDCVVDFGKQTQIHNITLRFLENQRLWLYKPESIRIYVSNDNIDFRLVDEQSKIIPKDHLEIERYKYSYNFRKAESYRYLRVVAMPLSYNPVWSSPTYSRKPMVACDEIWVN